MAPPERQALTPRGQLQNYCNTITIQYTNTNTIQYCNTITIQYNYRITVITVITELQFLPKTSTILSLKKLWMLLNLAVEGLSLPPLRFLISSAHVRGLFCLLLCRMCLAFCHFCALPNWTKLNDHHLHPCASNWNKLSFLHKVLDLGEQPWIPVLHPLKLLCLNEKHKKTNGFFSFSPSIWGNLKIVYHRKNAFQKTLQIRTLLKVLDAVTKLVHLPKTVTYSTESLGFTCGM